ncbi:Pyruvate dehydrogenase E1 component subunit alpha, somatic form, mitochondrial [Branchiostoma belcheri]|nr:Pyruvate dehydrogenase E1 component subunit alpha, somatic form, mitochondrial [Branchiostoma belcheri]
MTTRDPITGLRERMISANLATAEELKKGPTTSSQGGDQISPTVIERLCNSSYVFLYSQQIDLDIRAEIDKAVEQAKTDPEPPVEELYTDIFVDQPPFKVRGTNPFMTRVLNKEFIETGHPSVRGVTLVDEIMYSQFGNGPLGGVTTLFNPIPPPHKSLSQGLSRCYSVEGNP